LVKRRCADCCVEPDLATLDIAIEIEIVLYYGLDTRHQMDTWSQKEDMCAKRIASKCPIEELLVLIGGRWKPVILWWLIDGGQPLRFKVLRQSIPRISQKILTQQLRELERDGLVKREMFAEMGAQVSALAQVSSAVCVAAYAATSKARVDAESHRWRFWRCAL
jgi:DNA-binding HxlR family transcriptional regulator